MIQFKGNEESIRHHLIGFVGTVEYHREKDANMGLGQIADLYIKNEIDMEQGMQDYADYERELGRMNRRLLNAIKSVKGKTFYKHITDIIIDSEGIKGLACIVKEPVGEFQKEKHGREIEGIYVQQWSVGDSGDSWEGIVCVKIKEGKYLKYSYSM